MLKKKPLSVAIAAAVATTGMYSTNTYAEEGIVEEVVVTGSRIKTSVDDTPRPVSVYNRIDIELSGMETVADVLRNSAYNSIGSFRERSGTSFGQIALVDLRGLGADRTAVLINGRRTPGNPLTGTSAVDLNTIPLSAIERVEVLTDSASAIYGADAIGGVVNVIMRDDYDGAEFEIGTEEPTREGGDSDHVNFTFGARGERSSVLFSAEWNKKNPIFDKDRDYSKVQYNDNPNGGLPRQDVDTVGISGFGNTGFALPFFDEAFSVLPTCTGDGYYPVADPFGIPGVACGYGFADLSMQTGGIDRRSSFVNAQYEITPDHKVYIESRYTNSETFGRYAPAAGGFVISPTNPNNPRGHAAVGDVDGNGMLDDGASMYLGHRFVGHGNRDDNVKTIEFDNVVGLSGTFDFAGGVNYDVYVRDYRYTAQEEGDTYILDSEITRLTDEGDYLFANPLSRNPAHLAAVAQSSATLFRDISMDQTSAGLTLDGALFDLPAGQVGWAFGLETATEDYQDQYDSFREAGNVIGSAGNSSAGDRSRWATFGELEIPVLDTVSVSLAARYDDYDDIGDSFSPMAAVRWAAHDMLTVRASWGEGFKAPNLTSIHSELSQSFETVTDTARCRSQGISDANCPAGQVEEYTGGNLSIEPEESESWNIGFVVNPLDNLTIAIDYFNIEITEAVSTLDLQDVLDFEQAGTLPSGVVVNRGPTVNGVLGTLTRCAGADPRQVNCGIINVFANLATVEREGIDVRAQYDWATDGYGNFGFTLEYAKMQTYDERPIPTAAIIDRVGDEEYPEFRYNFNTRWTMNDWTVNYTLRYIDDTDGVTTGSYDDFTTHDLGVTWATPWGGELSAGARNLTDEDPPIDSVSGYDDQVVLELYDVAGRVPYLTYKHFF